MAIDMPPTGPPRADDRHSYLQRVHTLAGPGAYAIPSVFQQRAPNTLLRFVQRHIYGREFARQERVAAGHAPAAADKAHVAPCQLCLVTPADTHRARRDKLRRWLQLGSSWPQADHKRLDEEMAASSAPISSSGCRRCVSLSALESSTKRWPSSDVAGAEAPPTRTCRASTEMKELALDFGSPTASSMSSDVARGREQARAGHGVERRNSPAWRLTDELLCLCCVLAA